MAGLRELSVITKPRELSIFRGRAVKRGGLSCKRGIWRGFESRLRFEFTRGNETSTSDSGERDRVRSDTDALHAHARVRNFWLFPV